MHHQCHVNVFKAAIFQHPQFSMGSLFGGRAIDYHSIGHFSGAYLQGLSRSHDGRTLHMVPAGVAQPLQGVILTQQPDPRATLSVLKNCPKGGGDPSHTVFNLKSTLGQIAGDGFFCRNFLKSQLRMIIDIVSHGQEG